MRLGDRTAWLAVAWIGSVVGVQLGAPHVAATTIAVDCPQDSLSDALASARSGSTVQITGTCTGNFLVRKDLTLTGVAPARLDGGGTGSTLTIEGFADVHLDHLSIVDGSAWGGGGIQFYGGGSLFLDHVRVTGNTATGGGAPVVAEGAGVDVQDPSYVTITNSTIANNHASATSAGTFAGGGGLATIGRLTITGSSVTGNTVAATSTNSASADGNGGGILVRGSMRMTGTTVSNNRVTAQGPGGGSAVGGGIGWFASGGGSFVVSHSNITSNHADAPMSGQAGAAGGGLYLATNHAMDPVVVDGTTFDGDGASATSLDASAYATGGALIIQQNTDAPLDLEVSDTTFTNSSASAHGHTTADAHGGAVWTEASGTLTRVNVADNTLTVQAGSGIATGGGGGIGAHPDVAFTLLSSTVARNTATASSTSAAVSIGGGGLLVQGAGPTTIRGSTISGNTVTATGSLASTEADGGGIDLSGGNSNPGDLVIDSTIAGNTSTASGGSPVGTGGGLAVFDQHLRLRFDTVARNTVNTHGSGFGGGGGLYDEAGTNTIGLGIVLALNAAATGPDCVGTLGSGGYNLLSSDFGCGFPEAGTDQIAPNPKLGQLAANGGPTQTIALLAGSPALERMPKATCIAITATDQRGLVRPQGLKCDEGAFERKT